MDINPQSIRDLRLMYDTASRVDGIIEHANLRPGVMNSRDYNEGDIIGMDLRVVPSGYEDLVTVCVQRTQVTNLHDGCYSPRRLTDWSKEYSFAEFKESPFFQMCVDVWGSDRSGLVTELHWDTRLMDEHEVVDEGDRWYIDAHVYEHRRTWLGNWYKTGRIVPAYMQLTEDGEVSIFVDGGSVYEGDIWKLQRIVSEHEQMREQLDRLKEYGVDLESGTLSIRLWEG